jgi:hypothetical protein
LVKAWLAARRTLKDLFGSERTAATAIAKFLKALLPATTALARFTVAKQKCPSKALVCADLSDAEACASLAEQMGELIIKFNVETTATAAPTAEPPEPAAAELETELVMEELGFDLEEPATVVTMTDEVPFDDLPPTAPPVTPELPKLVYAQPTYVPAPHLVLAAQSCYRRDPDGSYRRKTDEEHENDLAALEAAWALCRGTPPTRDHGVSAAGVA